MAGHNKKLHRWVYLSSAILLSLIAIIVALIYSDNKKSGGNRTTLDAINSLRIQRPDFADIQLRLNDDRWTIEQPCQLDANMQRLEPLLGALLPATHSYPATDVDLDTAGLTEPLATVFLNDSRIDIGNTDLRGDRRYIKRGDQVEFAPDWILSLINGGLSAMARLEIFDQQISAIQVLDDTKTNFALSPEIISDWQELSAQQIVGWPLRSGDLALIAQSLNVQQGDTSRLLEVYTYEQFSALHYENEQCAFILSNESLPDITPP